MSEDKKVVVTIENSQMSAQGELDRTRRTAVFNESTTLKEVLDWARQRNDRFASILRHWTYGCITISEDEISNPKPERQNPFSLDTNEETFNL